MEAAIGMLLFGTGESHGIKSVNYQGLVPVLINALKEQDINKTLNNHKYD